ncbi:eCIS core domain-containing protein [Chitinolyticbacter meiyuanensis]|uniref:eCIS core domain-containing protein n=1 Tax=Chitinolyticbacter meiyuanensis TaxID=682798 RepID=UPI0011E5E5D1|nr:DUF4157 domain-containing protein [Chitinolyticbacter meiyuanensis]
MASSAHATATPERRPAPRVQRACSKCGGQHDNGPQWQRYATQAKGAQVDAPDSHFEREADRVAEQVVAQLSGVPGSKPAITPLGDTRIQRKCGCEEQGGALAQRKPGAIPRTAHQVPLNPDGGAPMSGGLRGAMERAFGEDFSGVRLHHDGEADAMSRNLGARAFTVGSHVYFANGEYAPSSPEGQRLLAHELTHVVQQGGQPHAAQPKCAECAAHEAEEEKAGPVVQRIGLPSLPSLSDVEDALSDVGDAVADTASDIGEGIVEGAEAVGEGVQAAGEAIVEGAEAAGEAIAEGAEAAGEAIVEGAEAIAEGAEAVADTVFGFARDVWDAATALASAIGGMVSISGTSLVITVPAMPVCPVLPFQFSLPRMDAHVPIAVASVTSGVLTVYGVLTAFVGLSPELSGQLGPCQLHGLRIVINPLGPSVSAAGAITATVAVGLGAQLEAGLHGELGMIIAWPDPPIVLRVPVIGAEVGLAGFARGIVASQVTAAGAMSASLSGVSLAMSQRQTLGLAADAGVAGFGELQLLGQNVCRLYWPLADWHDDLAIDSGFDLAFSAGRSGISASFNIIKPTLDRFGFDRLGIEIGRGMFMDDCPLCDWMRRLNLMPSGHGARWDDGGKAGPPHAVGPLSGVFPNDPGFASGSKCRGACGPDCKTCDEELEHSECETIDGGARHRFWVYPNYHVCGIHQGCLEHDSCFDWCGNNFGEVGLAGVIFGPCHRFCDLEAVCTYGAKNAIGWIFGAKPHSDYWKYSDPPRAVSECDGPCPADAAAGGGGPDAGAQGGGAGGAAGGGGAPTGPGRVRICMPEVILFNRRSVGDSVSESLPETEVWSTWIEAPPPVFLVELELLAQAGMEAGIEAGIGPARLTDMCMDVDPLRGDYSGTATLRIPADLTAWLILWGQLSANANWLALINVVSAIGRLEAEANGTLSTEFVGTVGVECVDGQPGFTTNVDFPGCIDLDFNLDAQFDLELVGYNLFHKRWRLAQAAWNHCWGEDIDIDPMRRGQDPDIDLSGESINLEDLIKWLLGGGGGGRPRPPGQLPAGGNGIPTGLTRDDPIEMAWYKRPTAYPATMPLATHQSATNCSTNADCSGATDPHDGTLTPTCTLLHIGRRPRNMCTAMADFRRTVPTDLRDLNTGAVTDRIGVPYFPDAGDIMVLVNPGRTETEMNRIKRRTARHGYRMSDHDQDADHVVDLDWGGPDHFQNLWPLDSDINQGAGREQNRNQRITFSEGPNGPVHTNITIGSFKDQGFHRRNPPHHFFVITTFRDP